MKKLLAMLCLLAVLVGCLALSVSAASTKTGYCQKCKTTVTWEPIVWGTQSAGHKHYYVPADTANATQMILKAGANACIDLNGKQIVQPTGRIFLLNGATAEAPASLSIQDSVGGATVTSKSYKYLNADGSTKSQSNNGAGGVMWVDNYCTLDIYGGSYFLDVLTPDSKMTSTGGILAIYNTAGGGVPGGVVNLYGGTLNGGNVSWVGGAVDLQSDTTFNVYGGIITRGMGQAGPGVNIRNNKSTKGGTIKLYNNARVDDLYLMNGTAGGTVYVDSSFTGEAYMKVNGTMSAGTAVATAGGTFTGELYCYNGSGFKTVVSGTAVNLAALDSGDRLKDCAACNRMKKWDAYTTTAPTTAGQFHYYFTQNYTTSTAKQYVMNAANCTVCLDMNGKTYPTKGRALYIAGAGSRLNVMDLVGGGEINGSGGNNNPGGGTVSVGSGLGSFNLYRGTLSYTCNLITSTFNGTGRGGVIQSSAPVNVYGGKIQGGEVTVSGYNFSGINGAGGAIYASAALNIYGGEITAGTCPETGAGPCIYVAVTSPKVFVANDAKVDDITFSGFNANQLTVSGAFSGKLNLTYPASANLKERSIVGIAANDCDLKKAAFTCGDYFVHAEDGKLILSTYSAGIPAATGGVGYNSLQAAIDACTDGLVELLNDTPEEVTVSRDVTLQMNGCSVGGATVAEGATLYLMDSATDDFTVADGVYGKISNVTGTVKGAAKGGDSYLIVNESGAISAHCVRLNIHTMTLRVDNTEDRQEPGLYYKSDFKADEKAAPQIATFGVALSVMQKPTTENLESDRVKYSVHDHFEGGADGN
ncbi:MAG: hypothetical protein IJZ13_02220, partial [Clostridia bacterium]|nr:hypothetical protein [Clostridia bacterium]